MMDPPIRENKPISPPTADKTAGSAVDAPSSSDPSPSASTSAAAQHQYALGEQGHPDHISSGTPDEILLSVARLRPSDPCFVLRSGGRFTFARVMTRHAPGAQVPGKEACKELQLELQVNVDGATKTIPLSQCAKYVRTMSPGASSNGSSRDPPSPSVGNKSRAPLPAPVSTREPSGHRPRRGLQRRASALGSSSFNSSSTSNVDPPTAPSRTVRRQQSDLHTSFQSGLARSGSRDALRGPGGGGGAAAAPGRGIRRQQSDLSGLNSSGAGRQNQNWSSSGRHQQQSGLHKSFASGLRHPHAVPGRSRRASDLDLDYSPSDHHPSPAAAPAAGARPSRRASDLDQPRPPSSARASRRMSTSMRSSIATVEEDEEGSESKRSQESRRSRQKEELDEVKVDEKRQESSSPPPQEHGGDGKDRSPARRRGSKLSNTSSASGRSLSAESNNGCADDEGVAFPEVLGRGSGGKSGKGGKANSGSRSANSAPTLDSSSSSSEDESPQPSKPSELNVCGSAMRKIRLPGFAHGIEFNGAEFNEKVLMQAFGAVSKVEELD